MTWMKRSLPAALMALAGIAGLGAVQAAAGAEKPAEAVVAPLNRIMEPLLSYKSFRLNSAQIDELVKLYCEQKVRRADEYGVVARYRCAASTGISEIRVSTSERGQAANKHVNYILMFMSHENFAPAKALMLKQLGAPKKSDKDYVRYVYAADKDLNKRGNPVISLARDEDQSVHFSISLEQGP